MELRTLKYFLAVAREENITRAAALLHLTQPTLSRQLIQMEKELGVKLLNRDRHRISLTSEGRLLLQRGQEIIALTEKTEKELQQSEKDLSGEIQIGCAETNSMALLSRMMISFRRVYPRISFYMYTSDADTVKGKIENGLLDLGLMQDPFDVSQFQYRRLPLEDKWYALMRRDCPLAGKAFIQPADLAEIPLIVPGRLSVHNQLENWFGLCGQNLNIAAATNLSFSNISILVENKVGTALTHYFKSIPDILCLRPLRPEIKNGSVLIWKKDQVFSAAASRFLQFIKDFPLPPRAEALTPASKEEPF